MANVAGVMKFVCNFALRKDSGQRWGATRERSAKGTAECRGRCQSLAPFLLGNFRYYSLIHYTFMLKFEVIGNLGGNAELHQENGTEFVTFKVAHNERYVKADGQSVDKTVWVSCVLNGRADGLLPYLVAGQQVYVSGDGSTRTYHSKTQRCLVAGIDIRVRQIQLIGGRPDGVPSVLFDSDGVQVNVVKYYQAVGKKNTTLLDRRGVEYTVDNNGWLGCATDQQGNANEQEKIEK